MTVTLSLARILRLPELQTRSIDPVFVRRYAQAYKANVAMPPITVAQVDKGPPLLVDGWHRFEALKMIGAHEVDVSVIEAGDHSEARWLAMKANLTHGRPLRPSERREAFRAFMKASQWRKGALGAKSLRDIGRELGASHNTVRAWMQKDFKRICRDWYGNDDDGSRTRRSGGLQKQSTRTMRDVVLENVDAALQAFRGIKEPTTRGEVIARLEDVLRTMKDAGDWSPWQPEVDF